MRTFFSPAAYVGILAVVIVTAWLVLTGAQQVRDPGDFARFSGMMFQLLAPLQLAVVLFLAGLAAAGAVAHEKDRKTLVLLMLTHMTNSEVVLGKLAASLISLLLIVFLSLPLFFLTAAWGGVSFGQILRVGAITLATAIAAGSIGSTLAHWREKTFQALATTVLALVAWVAIGEAIVLFAPGGQIGGLQSEAVAGTISPWQACQTAAAPDFPTTAIAADDAVGRMVAATGVPPVSVTWLYLGFATLITFATNLPAVLRVRAWNTTRERRALDRETLETTEAAKEETEATPQEIHAAEGGKVRSRRVWNNPILWREIRTWAYGRRVLWVRVAYLLIVAALLVGLFQSADGRDGITAARATATLVPLALLSLVLITAQSVTSLTSERDGKTLELLLVTDLSAKEIVFGKLLGVAYNAKEMLLLPPLLAIYLATTGPLRIENLVYLLITLGVLCLFVIVLGLHAGIRYARTQVAVATSLGTVFFLFVGVAVCMRMMVAFSGSFQAQLQPFLALVIGGGLGLYVALSAGRPSTAIGIASFLCPVATFYALTSYLLGYTLTVALVTSATYGFTTTAMLVPALSEINFATDRPVVED